MDAERWEQVQALFFAALDRDPEDWGAFLDEACRDDAALRAEVEAMLNVHEDSQALAIENRLFTEDPPQPDPEALLGTHVGPYRLKRLLGRGGMGDVYLAERDDEQYRQQVALKLVRPGVGTLDLLARFRTERQILARLVHPHIARLLDGGMTDDGRPYLVMQYIEGVPLTTFCNTHRLSIKERLHLFRQVCDAVQFAHRNLIVHRDLKPSNILVTEAGDVKLLDFGIAKLLDPEAIDVSVPVTRSEIRMMTPEYAAPEQVRGEAITTATDVYALGVLLYELLTDHRPYRLASRGQAEIERVICEEEPKRPSTAITEVEEIRRQDGTTEQVIPEQVSAARRVPVGRLQRLLRGDLDNIVMMTLRKEPARRYASVEGLAEDVHRHLTGLPVLARPDTTWYRVRKFVRRNRVGVGTAAVVFLLVLGFGVVMTMQAARIAGQAHALEQERDRVQREAEKTARVKTLVSDLFKVVDPNAVQGSPVERLEAASRRIVQDLEGQPDLQAELMDEVITIYINLGLYEAALSMAEASLDLRQTTFGPGDPAIAWGLHRLGEALLLNSRFAEAEARYQEALALQRAALGDDHVDVARTLVRLSRLYRSTRRDEEAEASAVEALAIYRAAYGDIHPATAEALYHLAVARIYLAGPEAAEPLFRDVLAVQREVLGEDHPDVAWTLVSLARVTFEQQQFDVAEPLLQDALAIHRNRYGDDHPDVSRTLTWIGRLHEARQELDQAEAIYRQVLASRRRQLGNEHSATAGSMIQLGQVLTKRGSYREAEALLQKALPLRRDQYGPGHSATLGTLRALVTLYDAWRQPDRLAEYRRLLEEATATVEPSALEESTKP